MAFTMGCSLRVHPVCLVRGNSLTIFDEPTNKGSSHLSAIVAQWLYEWSVFIQPVLMDLLGIESAQSNCLLLITRMVWEETEVEVCVDSWWKSVVWLRRRRNVKHEWGNEESWCSLWKAYMKAVRPCKRDRRRVRGGFVSVSHHWMTALGCD